MSAKVGASAGRSNRIAAILPGMPVKGGHGAVNGGGCGEGKKVVSGDDEWWARREEDGGRGWVLPFR
jgi:hypothetical protein